MIKAGISVAGVNAVRTELRNIADIVPRTARSQMRRSSERIVKRAKENCPEDFGSLVESIRIERDYEGIRGRLQIDVIAGGKEVLGRNGMIDLDQYAWIVHENYWNGVAYKNGPGPKTLAKIAQYGPRVGEKFLEEAANFEEPKLISNSIRAIQRAIEGSY